MKRIFIICLAFLPIYLNAQVSENFSDGDFTEAPIWLGTTANFQVTEAAQLRLNAPAEASTSYLSTFSDLMNGTTWECWVKMGFNPSANNYSKIYLCSSESNLTGTLNGYYIKLGGDNSGGDNDDKISLYKQTGTTSVKLINGITKRIDLSSVDVFIRVTRDEQGKWKLFTKLKGESAYKLEGSATDNTHTASQYMGMVCIYTSSNSTNFYFDNIKVFIDDSAPAFENVEIASSTSIQINYSKEVDYSEVSLTLPVSLGAITSQTPSADERSLLLTFSNPIEAGVIYPISIANVKDLQANVLNDAETFFGLAATISANDLIINEVMFDPVGTGADYLEIYNRSGKILDLFDVVLATRKTDGSITSSKPFSASSMQMLPDTYLALTPNKANICNLFICKEEGNLYEMAIPTMANESGTVLIVTKDLQTVIDELTYSYKWHHPMIKNVEGVALERINPEATTQDKNNWHSASSEVRYGTPGYKNSQYRIPDTTPQEKAFWLESEVFTPDNDGNNDILILHYKMPEDGYMANITIYDAMGQAVTKLVSSYLLSAEGTISWDSRTDKGASANIGVYVIYIEAYNATTGKTLRQKIPCVLSTR